MRHHGQDLEAVSEEDRRVKGGRTEACVGRMEKEDGGGRKERRTREKERERARRQECELEGELQSWTEIDSDLGDCHEDDLEGVEQLFLLLLLAEHRHHLA